MVKEQMPAAPKLGVGSPNPTPRGIGKDEVSKLVQEALAATQEENAERNAQVCPGSHSPLCLLYLTLRFNP